MISQLHKVVSYIPNKWITYVLTISISPNLKDINCILP